MPEAQTRTIPFNPAFPVQPSTPVLIYNVSGAVTMVNSIAHITKAGVAAMTLAAPTQDGIVITVVGTTANAHTLTITGGLNGAGAGADVGTFGGAVGDGVSVYSYGGSWWGVPGSNLNVTFA